MRVRVVFRGLLVVLALAMALAAPALAERRIALVIGNSAYQGNAWPPLKNPANDARLISDTLKSLHFEVTTIYDADAAKMDRAIRDLGVSLGEAGRDAVGVFYFAGHGFQSSNYNYIVPVDMRADVEQAAIRTAVRLGEIEQRMRDGGARLNFIILDSCRTNRMKSADRGETGFAPQPKSRNFLFAFSTGPNSKAADGAGANSPYAEALAAQLKAPGLPFEFAFKRAAKQVSDRVPDQVPYTESGIQDDFCFAGCSAAPPPVPPQPQPPPAQSALRGDTRIASSGADSVGRSGGVAPVGTAIPAARSPSGPLTVTLEHQIAAHKNTARHVVFSPNGKLLVSSGDNSARLWDVATGRDLGAFEGHTDVVWSAAFSPDGSRLVTASWDKTARVWDVATRKEIVRLVGHPDRIYGAVFSPDGRLIATAGAYDGTVIIWDATTGRQIRSFAATQGVWVHGVQFSPDGSRIVTANGDNRARIWNVNSGMIERVLEGHSGYVVSASFSADGARVLTASESDNTARIGKRRRAD